MAAAAGEEKVPPLDGPCEWRLAVLNLMQSAGVHPADVRVPNLLSLLAQQIVLGLTAEAVARAQRYGRDGRPALGDVQTVARAFLANSYFHPHSLEENMAEFARAVNLQPFAASADPSTCDSFNLCGPVWEVGGLGPAGVGEAAAAAGEE